MLIFSILMLTKGAGIGVKVINYVVVILAFTLILFFLGNQLKAKKIGMLTIHFKI